MSCVVQLALPRSLAKGSTKPPREPRIGHVPLLLSSVDEHRSQIAALPSSARIRARVGPSACSLAANDRVKAEVRGAESSLLQRRPSGTLGEAAALRTRSSSDNRPRMPVPFGKEC